MKLHRQGAIIAANVRHKAALDACILQDFRARLGPCHSTAAEHEHHQYIDNNRLNLHSWVSLIHIQ